MVIGRHKGEYVENAIYQIIEHYNVQYSTVSNIIVNKTFI